MRLKLLILWCFLSFVSVAQEWHYASSLHTGQIIKNYPSFPQRSFSFIGEVQITKTAQGTRAWHQYLKHPDIGGALFFGSLGNATVFGNLAGAMPIFKYRFFQNKLSLSVGLGVAYFHTYFDRVYNSENLFISTPFTYLASASLKRLFAVTPSIYFYGGISVLHASNGHFRMPNNGLNILSGTIGILFERNRTLLPDTFPDRNDNHWHFAIEAGGGWHDFGDGTSPLGGPLYRVGSLHGTINRFFYNSGQVIIGFTTTYYSDFYDYIVYQNFMKAKQLNAITFSTNIGYEFIFGRFAFLMESGILWWNPFYKKYKTATKTKGIINHLKFYINNRLGFRFFPFSQESSQSGFFIGTYIRANFGQADFNEISIGRLF